MKAYKVIISGSYKTANKEVIDYQNVGGFIPFTEPDKAIQMIQKRYAPMWIRKDPKYTKGLKRMRETFVDKMEEVEHKFSFEGKDIGEMTFEELQDVATLKDIRAVPKYKSGSLKNAQTVAYVLYSNASLGTEYDYKEAGFTIYDKPPLKVDEAYEYIESDSLDPEIAMKKEFDGEQTLTFDELKAEAKKRKIAFNPNIGYNTLYNRVFGG